MYQRVLKLFPVLAMLVALSALVPSLALAAPAPDRAHIDSLINQLSAAGDQRDQLFESFSPEDQKAVMAALTPGRVVVENEGVFRISDGTRISDSGISPLASGCWLTEPTVVQYSALGYVLYKYGTHYEWCGDGYTITSHLSYLIVSTPGPWWSYQGDVSYWETGGNGYDHFRVHRQGKMTYCPFNVSCIQTDYPLLDSAVYGNGSWGIL